MNKKDFLELEEELDALLEKGKEALNEKGQIDLFFENEKDAARIDEIIEKLNELDEQNDYERELLKAYSIAISEDKITGLLLFLSACDNLDIWHNIKNKNDITAQIIRDARKIKNALDAYNTLHPEAPITREDFEKDPLKLRRFVQEIEADKEKAKAAFQKRERVKRHELITNYKVPSSPASMNFYGVPEWKKTEEEDVYYFAYYFNQDKTAAIVGKWYVNKKILKDFDIEVPETETMHTDFDFFVDFVLGNNYEKGNYYLSIRDIYKELYGKAGSPSKEHAEQIRSSLIRGKATILNLSNKMLRENYGGDIKELEGLFSLLDVEIVKTAARKRGAPVNEQVLIKDYPLMFKISGSVNQFKTVNADILKLYSGARNARYWSIMKFLISMIGWKAREARENNRHIQTFKISLDRIGKKTGADKIPAKEYKKAWDHKEADRVMVNRLLSEVFKRSGMIKDFKFKDDAFVITVNAETAEPGDFSTLPAHVV